MSWTLHNILVWFGGIWDSLRDTHPGCGGRWKNYHVNDDGTCQRCTRCKALRRSIG